MKFRRARRNEVGRVEAFWSSQHLHPTSSILLTGRSLNYWNLYLTGASGYIFLGNFARFSGQRFLKILLPNRCRAVSLISNRSQRTSKCGISTKMSGTPAAGKSVTMFLPQFCCVSAIIQGLEFSLNLINRISRQQNPRQKKTVLFSGYLEQIGKEKQQWS